MEHKNLKKMYLSDFPLELIFGIFDYVNDIYDLVNLCEVSRSFHQYVIKFCRCSDLVTPLLFKFCREKYRSDQFQIKKQATESTLIYYYVNISPLMFKNSLLLGEYCFCYSIGKILGFFRTNHNLLVFDTQTKKILSNGGKRDSLSHLGFFEIDVKGHGTKQSFLIWNTQVSYQYFFQPLFLSKIPNIFSSIIINHHEPIRIIKVEEHFPMLKIKLINIKKTLYEIVINCQTKTKNIRRLKTFSEKIDVCSVNLFKDDKIIYWNKGQIKIIKLDNLQEINVVDTDEIKIDLSDDTITQTISKVSPY